MGRFSRYEFVQKIALGGMAEVWSARAVSPDGSTTDVVVKRILPQFANDEQFQNMLLEEAEVTAHLQHPNIVQVYDWGHLDDTCFLAMERVVGLDGRQLIDACGMRGIQITPAIALYVMGEIYKGLDFAHKRNDATGRPLGIVHRDVSPSNVLVSVDGAVKLADFGIAKAKTRSSHTVAGQVRGKPRYMSPEQAQGQEIDGRSDLFTAGIVLHEMLTGKPVFPPSTYLDEVIEVMKKGVLPPSKVNPKVPAELDALVLSLCERDLAKRPKSGAVAYEAIVEWARTNKLKLGPAPVAELVTGLVRPTQEKKSTAPKTETRIMRVEDVGGVPRFSTQGKMLNPDLAPEAIGSISPPASPSAAKRAALSARPPASTPDRDTAEPIPSTRLMEIPVSSDDAPEPEPRRKAARPAAPENPASPSTTTTEKRPPRKGGAAGVAGASIAVAAAIAVAVWWVWPRGESGPPPAEPTPALALDFEAAAAALAASASSETTPVAEVSATPEATAAVAETAPVRTPRPGVATGMPAATKKPKSTAAPEATAAPAVASGPGWLTLRSKPAGEVTIDGQWAGSTPLTKHELASGVHTVVVNSEDGRSASQQVTIVAGETTPVTLTLQ